MSSTLVPRIVTKDASGDRSSPSGLVQLEYERSLLLDESEEHPSIELFSPSTLQAPSGPNGRSRPMERRYSADESSRTKGPKHSPRSRRQTLATPTLTKVEPEGTSRSTKRRFSLDGNLVFVPRNPTSSSLTGSFDRSLGTRPTSILRKTYSSSSEDRSGSLSLKKKGVEFDLKHGRRTRRIWADGTVIQLYFKARTEESIFIKGLYLSRPQVNFVVTFHGLITAQQKRSSRSQLDLTEAPKVGLFVSDLDVSYRRGGIRGVLRGKRPKKDSWGEAKVLWTIDGGRTVFELLAHSHRASLSSSPQSSPETGAPTAADIEEFEFFLDIKSKLIPVIENLLAEDDEDEDDVEASVKPYSAEGVLQLAGVAVPRTKGGVRRVERTPARLSFRVIRALTPAGGNDLDENLRRTLDEIEETCTTGKTTDVEKKQGKIRQSMSPTESAGRLVDSGSRSDPSPAWAGPDSDEDPTPQFQNRFAMFHGAVADQGHRSKPPVLVIRNSADESDDSDSSDEDERPGRRSVQAASPRRSSRSPSPIESRSMRSPKLSIANPDASSAAQHQPPEGLLGVHAQGSWLTTRKQSSDSNRSSVSSTVTDSAESDGSGSATSRTSDIIRWSCKGRRRSSGPKWNYSRGPTITSIELSEELKRSVWSSGTSPRSESGSTDQSQSSISTSSSTPTPSQQSSCSEDTSSRESGQVDQEHIRPAELPFLGHICPTHIALDTSGLMVPFLLMDQRSLSLTFENSGSSPERDSPLLSPIVGSTPSSRQISIIDTEDQNAEHQDVPLFSFVETTNQRSCCDIVRPTIEEVIVITDDTDPQGSILTPQEPHKVKPASKELHASGEHGPPTRRRSSD